MQKDPTYYQRVERMDARKANRLRLVETLPSKAEEGDSVLMGGQLHVYAKGEWTNIDAVVTAKLDALAGRVKDLEDN